MFIDYQKKPIRQDSNEIFVMQLRSSIIVGYGLDDRGIVVRFLVRQGIFGSFKHSDRIRSPRSLLFSVYCGRFPKRLKKSQSAVKYTRMSSSARLRISRALYPLSHILIFVVPSIMHYSSEISPTRCNNCVFILLNGFTLHVSGDNLTHHQEYICCIWAQVSRLT